MDVQVLLAPFLDEKGRLLAFPAKRKKKNFALQYLAQKFEPQRLYTEQEVNDLLDAWHCFHDPAMLRRELFNCGFLGRRLDGKAYWLSEQQPNLSDLPGTNEL
ncbi:MAG: DUF2087 domain-containing protein [Oscillospiraceae bacterium]|nr:DUF2087 domain-containing protein [Oscillospiraceae bacterium]